MDERNFVDIRLEGKTYKAFVGNEDHLHELVLLEQAIEGDKYAREELVHNKLHGWIFLGWDRPLWAHVTENSIIITEAKT